MVVVRRDLVCTGEVDVGEGAVVAPGQTDDAVGVEVAVKVVALAATEEEEDNEEEEGETADTADDATDDGAGMAGGGVGVGRDGNRGGGGYVLNGSDGGGRALVIGRARRVAI